VYLQFHVLLCDTLFFYKFWGSTRTCNSSQYYPHHRVSASGSSFWNIPPQFTEGLCTTLDSAIDKLMGQCFGLKSEELSTFNKIRIHLPIRLGGLGVRELSHVRFAEFIGVMDGIPPLLPQHHDDGELHGKLNKLYMEHWIGENCLMSEHGTWSKIISRNESALGYGINLAFTSMCN